jgi:glycine/D-amino acid oxidase-like deaminating enzyme
MYLPRDGHVDPVFATSRYLAAAKRYGATVLYPCEVTAIDRRPGAPITVQTSRGPFTVDRLVTAGGVDTPHLMSLVDYKLGLLHAPGLAVRTTPQPIQTRMAYEAAGVIEFKQQANGQVAATYLAPPDLPVHAGIRAHPMDYPSEELRQFHGRMLIQKTAAFMPALAKAEPESVLIGFRPMPLDKLPVVGPIPGSDGVYVVVTHSGVTLSPILGQLVAGEVLTGAPAPSLAAFRPQRFV